MHGANITNHPGTYETQGIPSDTTFPGGRRRCVTWIDSDDNLWLYAGVTVTGNVWSGTYRRVFIDFFYLHQLLL